MSDETAVHIDYTFRYADTDNNEIELRQVALGLQSVVLVEPHQDEDGNITFNVDSTNLEPSDLANVFLMLGQNLTDNLEAANTTVEDDEQ